MMNKNAKTYAKRIADRVMKDGEYVNGTREIVGFSDKLVISPSFWLKRSGADCTMMDDFFDRVLQGEEFTAGPYRSYYYTFLRKEIPRAAMHFETDGPYTRRSVVVFPDDHCFTSIQVLVRPGTFDNPGHKATIIVNMRSCNVDDNFANDLYLAYAIVRDVLTLGFGAMHNISVKDMIVNIGSLHSIIFK